MALLERLDRYDIARTTNWTPTYVSESELFPPEMSGDMGIPMSEWETYDEPYKQTYPEYVKVQREKDAGAYSVKATLERSQMFENADPGWLSVLEALRRRCPRRVRRRLRRIPHGEVRQGARAAQHGYAGHDGRDPPRAAPALLPHEYCSKDRQFDWAFKAYDTNE